MAELRSGDSDAVAADVLAAVVASYPEIGPGRLQIVRNALSPNSAACVFEAGGCRYFAKGSFPERKTADWLAREHAVAASAAEAGLPVPRIIRNAAGTTVTEIGGLRWTVSETAAGEDRYKDASVFEPFRTLGEAEAAGRMLAKFHLALKGHDLPQRPFVGPVAQYGFLQLESLEIPHPEWNESRELFRKLSVPDIPDALRVIHGDWIKRNLFWEGDEISAILDFDLVNRGAWVFDLALAINALAYPWPLLKAGGEPHVAQGHALRKGYEAIRPLGEAEAAMLPALTATCRFEYHLSLALTALREGDAKQAAWFWDGQVASLRWWYNHRPDG
jgi:Ser/Thr protein kinase RdoA (MazF antagonist)